MTATGRKKLDELYHPVTDRSEFYNMQDLAKPPVLFTPSEDADKLSGMDLQSFYGHEADAMNTTQDKSALQYLVHSAQKPATPTLKFHNHFPPDVPQWVKQKSNQRIKKKKKCKPKSDAPISQCTRAHQY